MSDYKVKPNEQGYVHVRFTKIMKGKGKRTYDVHKNQLFSVKEFEAHKKSWEKYGFAGITQQDEYVVLHDPRDVNKAEKEAEEKERLAKIEQEKRKEIEAEEKKNREAELKAKGEAIKKEAEKEANNIRKYLTDNDVKFHAKLGLKKLKELKSKTELNT